MHQIHPDASLVELLARMAAADFHYHLYTNNFTPDRDTVLGDLTEQGVGDGYAIVTVAAADFTASGVVAHHGSIVASPIAFTVAAAGGPWTIYGYFVTDTGDAELLACGLFDAAPLTVAEFESVLVTPIFGDQSLFSS